MTDNAKKASKVPVSTAARNFGQKAAERSFAGLGIGAGRLGRECFGGDIAVCDKNSGFRLMRYVDPKPSTLNPATGFGGLRFLGSRISWNWILGLLGSHVLAKHTWTLKPSYCGM